jgi:hypothetical protein
MCEIEIVDDIKKSCSGWEESDAFSFFEEEGVVVIFAAQRTLGLKVAFFFFWDWYARDKPLLMKQLQMAYVVMCQVCCDRYSASFISSTAVPPIYPSTLLPASFASNTRHHSDVLFSFHSSSALRYNRVPHGIRIKHMQRRRYHWKILDIVTRQDFWGEGWGVWESHW